jgi:hypothetical protein
LDGLLPAFSGNTKPSAIWLFAADFLCEVTPVEARERRGSEADFDLSDEKSNTVRAGEFIVGTLIHAGIIKQEDAERAIKIVEEELGVWLAIRKFNEPPNRTKADPND